MIAAPVTYEVDGEQYVAVLASWCPSINAVFLALLQDEGSSVLAATGRVSRLSSGWNYKNRLAGGSGQADVVGSTVTLPLGADEAMPV